MADTSQNLGRTTVGVVAWSGRLEVVATDPAVAIDRLPGAPHEDPYKRLAKAFIAGYPANTTRAYPLDLQAWAGCCAAVHLAVSDHGSRTPGACEQVWRHSNWVWR